MYRSPCLSHHCQSVWGWEEAFHSTDHLRDSVRGLAKREPRARLAEEREVDLGRGGALWSLGVWAAVVIGVDTDMGRAW